MFYITSTYRYGGTAVEAYTDEGEPYATCSINLSDYGIIPEPGQIIIPTYQFSEELNEKFIFDLAEEVIATVPFGPYDAKGVLIRLKPEYQLKDGEGNEQDNS